MSRSWIRSGLSILRYLFHPNPGHAGYPDTAIIGLFILLGALVALSIIIRLWRGRIGNPMTRTLSRSWSSAAFWFGLIGLILVVARVEAIQFIAMRFLWVLWWGSVGLYVLFQVRQFMTRHYAVVREVRSVDPLMKYLPGRKKRK